MVRGPDKVQVSRTKNFLTTFLPFFTCSRQGTTPVESWNLRVGSIHVQTPRVITDANTAICRLAWVRRQIKIRMNHLSMSKATTFPLTLSCALFPRHQTATK